MTPNIPQADPQEEIAALKEAYDQTFKEYSKLRDLKKAMENRVKYLIDAEGNAIAELDRLQIGTPERTLKWSFIRELCHRRHELQELLK